MAWFQKLCKHSGLLLHDVVHAGEKHRVTRRSKRVREKRRDPQVTLRRTTIDEVEYTQTPGDPQSRVQPNPRDTRADPPGASEDRRPSP